MSAFLFLLTLKVAAFAYPQIPDPKLTQGATCSVEDPDFMERRYPERITVCDRNVSQGLKRIIYKAYDIPMQCRNRYTVDHFIPLSIGGNNSMANLWPEHRLLKAMRQDLEQKVFDQVAAGTLTQGDAIKIIVEAKTHPIPGVWFDSQCDIPNP